jgi:hypothetical protein
MVLLRRGFWRVDLKNPTKAAFLFFFSNDLLSFNPFDPTIRLRFQTLFGQGVAAQVVRIEHC